ncbi:hypothetical protein AMECASPLE_016864 [Ameca splendens]|uniref:Uncharacterized protein n=1 Tax=Ameca splendens TaxID=208324 RepID=A0ABV0YDX1_9TELE
MHALGEHATSMPKDPRLGLETQTFLLSKRNPIELWETWSSSISCSRRQREERVTCHDNSQRETHSEIIRAMSAGLEDTDSVFAPTLPSGLPPPSILPSGK